MLSAERAPQKMQMHEYRYLRFEEATVQLFVIQYKGISCKLISLYSCSAVDTFAFHFITIEHAENGITDSDGNLLTRPVDMVAPVTREEPVVLGKAMLEEIWKDQEKLILPSFVSPAPSSFGSEKRKLTADQWHSVGMIHLVISLHQEFNGSLI